MLQFSQRKKARPGNAASMQITGIVSTKEKTYEYIEYAYATTDRPVPPGRRYCSTAVSLTDSWNTGIYHRHYPDGCTRNLWCIAALRALARSLTPLISEEDYMSQQEAGIIKRERFINVRKAAALDIALHGSGFILAEFGLGVPLLAAISAFMFFRSDHSLFTIAQGCFFLWLTLNYVPLLLYAISIVRQKSAYQEVAFELEHKDSYLLKYTLQLALFLFIPFALLALAIYQEWQKRRSR
jgi:hypothetical protein